jgi:hypothetical protein
LAGKPVHVSALAYDDLPEGSTLRREFDGQGGVIIVAAAGEVSAASRRWVAGAALLPACAACAVCALAGGLILHTAIRANRVDPSLRVAAFVTLGVLAGGFFLFGWWGEYASRTRAMAEARRQSTVLHANPLRLLVEREGAVPPSIEVATSDIRSILVLLEPVTSAGQLRSPRVPFVQLRAGNGSILLLLGGHHPAELRWVVAALAEAMGVRVD